jgi:putative lipoprotein
MGALAMIHRLAVLAGCFAALTLAACATTPEPSVDKTPPVEKEETTARPIGTGETVVTGSVFYLERIALTPEAVVRVEVVEVEGGKESVIGEQTLSSPGQVPIRFSVGVPAERIRPEGTYIVRARITDAGRTFTTPEPVPVLTQGHPSQDVRVRVRIGG